MKFEDMMKELFTPKERAAIRQKARRIAKRYMALRELRKQSRVSPARDR